LASFPLFFLSYGKSIIVRKKFQKAHCSYAIIKIQYLKKEQVPIQLHAIRLEPQASRFVTNVPAGLTRCGIGNTLEAQGDRPAS